MDDLARLGVDVRVVLRRLQLGEHLQRGSRQLGPEEQRLQAGDDRVAPEHGHEPRHACCRQAPGATAPAHPQRGEVGDGLLEGPAELVPVGADLRHAELPGRERLAHARELLAEAPLGDARRDRVAVDRREDVEPQRPGLARAELEPVDDLGALDLPTLREDDLRRRSTLAVHVAQNELVVLLLVTAFHFGRQRARLCGVAECEVVLR